MFDNSTHPAQMRLPEKRTGAFSALIRRNLTILNVLQQNIGGFCPLAVCALEV
jgi:hypothetical protein